MEDVEANDYKSIFVSRIPIIWQNEDLIEAFETNYGKVENACISLHKDSGDSRCFGFVTFESEEDKIKALKSLHLKGKLDRKLVDDYNKDMKEKEAEREAEDENSEEQTTPFRHIPLRRPYSIKISEIDRDNYKLGRGRDTDGICHLYQRGICPRSAENCKFAHTGRGGTQIPGEGSSRRKCFLFKKNKCKMGDKCEYLHIGNPKAMKSGPNDERKPCFNWMKSGKCKKENCEFSHEESMKNIRKRKNDNGNSSDHKKSKKN